MVVFFFSLISWPALLIASILLSIGLIQAIFEDVRQIGIRKALGFTNRQIIVYYMIMGIILYSIGSVIGILASYVASYSALLILSKLLGKIKFVLNLSAVLRNILIGFIIAVLASLIPALHVTKINPNHAIKYGIEKLEFARKKISRVRNYPLSVRLAWRNISRRKKRGVQRMSALMSEHPP
ncbi:MAG: ABC transporter permease [Candidatus Asgardarchaeia archaeon]